MADDVIRIENVVKRFAGHTAVAGLSMGVPRGGIFGLLGPTAPARPRPSA